MKPNNRLTYEGLENTRAQNTFARIGGTSAALRPITSCQRAHFEMPRLMLTDIRGLTLGIARYYGTTAWKRAGRKLGPRGLKTVEAFTVFSRGNLAASIYDFFQMGSRASKSFAASQYRNYDTAIGAVAAHACLGRFDNLLQKSLSAHQRDLGWITDDLLGALVHAHFGDHMRNRCDVQECMTRFPMTPDDLQLAGLVATESASRLEIAPSNEVLTWRVQLHLPVFKQLVVATRI